MKDIKDELIEFMSNYKFGYDDEKKEILINEFSENTCKIQFNLGFAEIYRNGHAKLLDGYVFYSGVFPNILKLVIIIYKQFIFFIYQ